MKNKLLFLILAFFFLILFSPLEVPNEAIAQSSDPVIVGAGDISPQRIGTQFQTADLIQAINPTAVITFGDNQYPDGALSDFNLYYDPSWGKFKAKTYPAPGNHDYHLIGASGYFDYFNGVGQNTGRAGERGKGYYSFDIGSWHLISLNSEITASNGSPQETWLRNDLAAHSNACTLAYMHKPRFSSGSSHGSNLAVAPLFQALYDFKADIVLAGHDHLYERFGLQNPSGVADSARGIRMFVVGTGGASLYSFGSPIANSEVRIATYGIIKLILHANSYDWQFINLNSQVLDSGSGNCVGGGTFSTPTPTPSSATKTPTPFKSPTPGGASPSRTPTPITGCPRKSQGDADCNGKIDIVDFGYWWPEFTGISSNLNADFDGDGITGMIDFGIWYWNFISPVPTGTSPSPTPVVPSATNIPSPTRLPSVTPTNRPTPSPTLGVNPSPTPILQAKPNIIFILTDDQTAESVSAMPYLSSRTDWFNFTQATVNVAYCCPSRATILTGKYAHHTGVIDNGSGALMNENQTIVLALQKAGYRTGLIGKYLNGFPFGRPYYIPAGWNHWEAYAPVNPPGQYNYGMNENGNLVSYGSTPADYSTDVVARKAIKFLETVQQPFFLYVAPYTPHGPMIPAPRHIGAYANQPMPRFPNFNEADVSDKPAWVRRLSLTDTAGNDGRRRSQYEMLLSVDEMIEKIVATIEAKGILDNTVIIYMTDNGYSHGEHRYRQKLCEYEECIRSPLKIRFPYSSPRMIDALVQNIDIAPTLADLAGISFTTNDGLSIMPLLKNQSTAWRTGTLHYWKGDGTVTGFWAIRRKDWKYVELVTGERELYNLINDPYELVNLAGQNATSNIQAQLAAELLQLKQ